MIKQPLFGQDSSPHITSMLISAIATLVCWIIFCVLCFVVKFKPAVPEYKEIQIVLSSTPTEQKVAEEQSAVQESAAAVPEPVEGPAVEETVVEQQTVEVPVVKETPKPKTVETKSTTTNTQKTNDYNKVNFDDYQYQTDMEDAINNQFNKTNNQKQFRDDLFTDDDNTITENKNTQKIIVKEQSGASGSAGLTDNKSTQGAKSSDTKNNSQDTYVSETTKNALGNIANATSYKKQTGSVESTVMAETTKSNGYVNMKMSDGSTRALIEPLTPAITLSPEAAKAVGNTVTVRIKFYVSKVGNVKSEISILYQNNDNSAESLLPSIVRNEIYDQLKKWVFEPGTSEAFAIFEFTIKKQ